MRTTTMLLILTLVVACRSTPVRPNTPSGGAVEAVAHDYWEEDLRHDPLWASAVGDHRYDDRLPDLAPAEHERHLAALRALAARAQGIETSELDGESATTVRVLLTSIATQVATEVCHRELWSIDQLGGPQEALGEMSTDNPARAQSDVDHLAARYRTSGNLIDAHIANLRAGLSLGLVAARINVERVVKQLDGLVATPAEQSTFVDQALPAAWTSEQKKAARETLAAAVRETVLPTLTRYRDFLTTDLLPRARAQPGVAGLANGTACYQALIVYHTGSTLTPEQIHALGLEELGSIEKEMATLAHAAGGPDDIRSFAHALAARTDQYVKSESALLEANRALLARAQARLPRVFGRLPKRPIEVKAIESFRAGDAPAAYYYGAPDDGSRPAYYYVNTLHYERRPLFNAAALAFHESVPGHHLQIAIAQDLALPDFRRQEGQTAFVEGWALYAERLADDLGLYQTPAERFGMLNFQAWRACRLVVDTGLHALGWSREETVTFLRMHTALPDQEIQNEVDRYIADPAQALAYKLGQREILRLRAEAKGALGDRFDLRAFHDRLLEHGAVPMQVATKTMETWIAAEAAIAR